MVFTRSMVKSEGAGTSSRSNEHEDSRGTQVAKSKKNRRCADVSESLDNSNAQEPHSTKRDQVSASKLLQSSIEEIIKCSICLDIMYKPSSVRPCGHTYCLSCILHLKASDFYAVCPQLTSKISWWDFDDSDHIVKIGLLQVPANVGNYPRPKCRGLILNIVRDHTAKALVDAYFEAIPDKKHTELHIKAQEFNTRHAVGILAIRGDAPFTAISPTDWELALQNSGRVLTRRTFSISSSSSSSSDGRQDEFDGIVNMLRQALHDMRGGN